MRSLAELEAAIGGVDASPDPALAAEELLGIGLRAQMGLESFVARDADALPTRDTREGFRLLALHRQGTRNDPSFNACRETCRELVYYYNLITMQPDHAETTDRVALMKMICSHLFLFISGKLQVAELGEFCCSSKPIRQATPLEQQQIKES